MINLFSCQESRKNSLKDWNLNGSVKNILSQTYEPKYEDGKVLLGDSIKYPSISFDFIAYYNNSEVNFNREGFITKHTFGSWFDKYNYNYVYKDDKLRKIETTRKTRGYDEYYPKTKKSSQYYEYNNGKLSKIINKDAEENIESISNLKTNTKGHIISGINIDNKRRKKYSWQNSYKGEKLIKTIQIDTLGEQISQDIYDYNSNGDIIKIEQFNKDKLQKTLIYKFDEFDENKNWIRAKIYENRTDSVSYVVARKINYYPEQNISANKISEKELRGIWQETDNKYWIEFKKNNKYDWGKNEYIQDMGSFELNAKNNILTFISKKEDNSKKYKIEYRDNRLHLISINRNREIVFEKK